MRHAKISIILMILLITECYAQGQEEKTPGLNQALQLSIQAEIGNGNPPCAPIIYATFRNTGAQTVVLANPADTWPDGAKTGYHQNDKIGKSEMTIYIVLPDGKKIHLRNSSHGPCCGFVGREITLKPGESQTVTLSKLGHNFNLPFWFIYPDKIIDKPIFYRAGLYELKVTYRNFFSKAWLVDGENTQNLYPVWTGEIISNPFTIEIKETCK